MALVVGALSIAFAPIFAVLAQEQGGIGPATSGFWRVALSSVVLGGVVLWLRRRSGTGNDTAVEVTVPKRPRLKRHLFLVGLFFAGDLVTWHWAFHFTQPANATLLANCQVFIVGFVGWYWLRERVGTGYLVGTVLAIVGTAILLGADFAEESSRAWGYLLGLCTAVFYAAYLLSVKGLRGQISTVALMFGSTVACTVCLLPFALAESTLSSSSGFVPSTAESWFALSGLAVISHCLGQGLIAFSLGRLPASFSAVTLLIQPPVVVALQWAILGETIGWGQAGGGAILLLGILLARLSSR